MNEKGKHTLAIIAFVLYVALLIAYASWLATMRNVYPVPVFILAVLGHIGLVLWCVIYRRYRRGEYEK